VSATLNAAGARRDVVVIGGSAGSIESLKELVGKLPEDLDVAAAAVIHLNPFHKSKLVNVIARVARIPVVAATEGQLFEGGRLYLAVPDHHLVIGETMRLTRGPKEHFHRPAIDVLFRSATGYGQRVVGVLLSGATTDGVSGATAIKAAGGIILVEDPLNARYRRLPATALVEDGVDASVTIPELAQILPRLARGEKVEIRSLT
jgi:two-component system chemotaxis response regulator CheB